MGIGHAADRRKTAAEGSGCSRRDRLGRTGVGLTQVSVDVDKPGSDDAPFGIEDPSTLYQHLSHADDFSLRLVPAPGSGHAAVFASYNRP